MCIAFYYPTSLRRVQITPKTSTNITRLDRFSRNAQETNWIHVTKKKIVCQNEFLFYVLSCFVLSCLELMCHLDDRRTIFFRVVKSEINCVSDGLVETTKTSLPCCPAVDQSVSWTSGANSVPLRVLLSRIPCK